MSNQPRHHEPNGAYHRHRAATAEYTEAASAYEAAAMSGDQAALAEADRRLRDADDAYGKTAAALLAPQRRSRRHELPPFEEILAHPWSQPGVIYTDVVDQSAGLPVRPGDNSVPRQHR